MGIKDTGWAAFCWLKNNTNGYMIDQTMKYVIIIAFLLAPDVGQTNVSGQQPYDARITGKEILTPEPSRKPKINSPERYGARPGKPFVYRIPATGVRPMTFEARGLPPSLMLDPQKGIITGRTPGERGEYEILFRASNAAGQDEKQFALVVGEGLALTPIMGWNHWYTHYHFITDEQIRAAADAMVSSGMADAGYQYISIDDCWMRISPENVRITLDPGRKTRSTGLDQEAKAGRVRDENGQILPARDFPDMEALTGHIHGYGLKAGIYTSPGETTCQLFEGSYGHEIQDARTYAEWGFDLLKYDWCSYGQLWNLMKGDKEENRSIPYKLMGGILETLDRDIVLNICEYGHRVWEWGREAGGHSWRVGGDLGHTITEGGVYRIAEKNIGLREYNGPGSWNDPDYLILGMWRSPFDKAAPLHPVELTSNEQYSYFSLWCMMACPLFFSGDMGTVDNFTRNILCNSELIAVNQDRLGKCAEPVRMDTLAWVLKKTMADGSAVLGFFNLSAEKDAEIGVTWREMDICCRQQARDLWRQKDIGNISDEMSVKVGPRGCAVIRLKSVNPDTSPSAAGPSRHMSIHDANE
jgi:alpha-galactosidase